MCTLKKIYKIIIITVKFIDIDLYLKKKNCLKKVFKFLHVLSNNNQELVKKRKINFLVIISYMFAIFQMKKRILQITFFFIPSANF